MYFFCIQNNKNVQQLTKGKPLKQQPSTEKVQPLVVQSSRCACILTVLQYFQNHKNIELKNYLKDHFNF